MTPSHYQIHYHCHYIIMRPWKFSALGQVMAWSLMAPSHYLIQYDLSLNDMGLWHIGSGICLLLDCTKPLPDPMLSPNHKRQSHVANTGSGNGLALCLSLDLMAPVHYLLQHCPSIMWSNESSDILLFQQGFMFLFGWPPAAWQNSILASMFCQCFPPYMRYNFSRSWRSIPIV